MIKQIITCLGWGMAVGLICTVLWHLEDRYIKKSKDNMNIKHIAFTFILVTGIFSAFSFLPVFGPELSYEREAAQWGYIDYYYDANMVNQRTWHHLPIFDVKHDCYGIKTDGTQEALWPIPEERRGPVLNKIAEFVE